MAVSGGRRPWLKRLVTAGMTSVVFRIGGGMSHRSGLIAYSTNIGSLPIGRSKSC
jgi:hypothetical protein